jgi:8-oxo-dGTP diphosphatase
MSASSLSGFNIRVYAVCIKDGKLFTLREKHGKWDIIKLPGGGLELDEGPKDCLIREFKEELNLEIDVIDSFYIQEEYVTSIVKDNRQIVLLYFLVNIKNIAALKISDAAIVSSQWMDISEICPLSLPVDKMMYEKIKRLYLK